MPVRGWDTVTVPGCVSAWVELHRKFGKLPFRKLFERAIHYGREGFLVSPTIAGQWQAQVAELKDQPGFAQAFMPGGRAPRAGERFVFKKHAEALDEIASKKGQRGHTRFGSRRAQARFGENAGDGLSRLHAA